MPDSTSGFPRLYGTAERGVEEYQTMVTVYSFKWWDSVEDREVIQPFKSTMDRILNVARGEPILETAEEVDESDLDNQGRYDPRKSKAKV